MQGQWSSEAAVVGGIAKGLNVPIFSKNVSCKYKDIHEKYRKHKEACHNSDNGKQWLLYTSVVDDVLGDRVITEYVAMIDIGVTYPYIYV